MNLYLVSSSFMNSSSSGDLLKNEEAEILALKKLAQKKPLAKSSSSQSSPISSPTNRAAVTAAFVSKSTSVSSAAKFKASRSELDVQQPFFHIMGGPILLTAAHSTQVSEKISSSFLPSMCHI